MLVYVINQHGKPLMPTTPSKARKLLKENKVKIASYTPFTIQLLCGSSGYKQKIVLGIDAGSKYIGLSATTENEELFSGEVKLRTNISKLISTKKQYRKSRRNRKTRYRQARFLNRTATKKEGWLAPSIQNKIQSHLVIVEKLHKILPITKIIAEVASFDIHKIKNPTIQGKEYQQGNQLGFWNVREYVLFRDGHKCNGKKGCKNKILNVHHIESRKTGGNSQDNLITLCEDCHKNYHSGKLKLNLKRGKSFRDAAFMGIMRWSFYNKLKESYNDVNLTYGYITKNTRISNGLPKEHRIDAYCIANNITASRVNSYYKYTQVRKKKRSLHEATARKGRKKPNIYSKRNSKNTKQVMCNNKLWALLDKVKLGNSVGIITGFASKTAYIQDFDGKYIQDNKKYKQVNLNKLELICRNNNWVCNRVISVE
jgi:N6-L-threonylcarbamoyladenine synthase